MVAAVHKLYNRGKGVNCPLYHDKAVFHETEMLSKMHGPEKHLRAQQLSNIGFNNR
jgi:hypothetical protein